MSSEICSICHDAITENTSYTIPECNHSFHNDCIIQWFRNYNSTCPLCREAGPGDFVCNKQQRIRLIKQHIKKNLLIFVTVWLIDSSGKKIKN